MKFNQFLQEIREVVEPMLQSQGLELVDLEYQREVQGWVLRVYIDREGGISVEDCAAVSGELGAILEVKDLIQNPYLLEVSSPGLTRPLKKREDFNKYRNHLIHLKTFEPIDGRKNFNGILLGLEEEKVRLEVEGRIIEISYKNIAKTNLEIEI